MQIKDITIEKVSQIIDLTAILKDASFDFASNGEEYAKITYADKTGSIIGIIWNIKPFQKEFIKSQVGKVTSNYVKVNNYKERVELRIETITENSSPTDDFIESAPIPKENLQQYINIYINQICNQNYKKIVVFIIGDVLDKFQKYQASLKSHHAYQSGLIYHTALLTKNALAICSSYPFINQDLLIAGCLLHDIGKTESIDEKTQNHKTIEGELLGNSEIALEKIIEACFKNNINHKSEDILLLKHLVASAYGKKQFGAITEGKIPEAIILHLLDKLDSEINVFEKSYQNQFDNTIEKSGGHVIYKPKKDY